MSLCASPWSLSCLVHSDPQQMRAVVLGPSGPRLGIGIALSFSFGGGRGRWSVRFWACSGLACQCWEQACPCRSQCALTRPPPLPQPGDTLADGGSVLDFVSVKPYPDVSLDMAMLGTLGRPPTACSPQC